MDFNEVRFANIMWAARAAAMDLETCAPTIDEISMVCEAYGVPLETMTDDELNEFHKILNSYLEGGFY